MRGLLTESGLLHADWARSGGRAATGTLPNQRKVIVTKFHTSKAAHIVRPFLLDNNKINIFPQAVVFLSVFINLRVFGKYVLMEQTLWRVDEIAGFGN